MNLLVVGCGTVGATLAVLMCREGHDVSVIDRSPDGFAMLGEEFTGLTMVGNPIDQDFLRRAGIEGCDAVAAVTSSDNVNVMVSQLARALFGIERVLTRIYDPAREAVFAQFGLRIICPTALTVGRLVDILLKQEDGHSLCIGKERLRLRTLPVPEGQGGRALDGISLRPGTLPTALLHADGTLTLLERGKNPVVAADDQIVVTALDRGGKLP